MLGSLNSWNRADDAEDHRDRQAAAQFGKLDALHDLRHSDAPSMLATLVQEMRDGRQRAVEDEHVVARELHVTMFPMLANNTEGRHVDVRAQEIIQRTHQAVLRAIHGKPQINVDTTAGTA